MACPMHWNSHMLDSENTFKKNAYVTQLEPILIIRWYHIRLNRTSSLSLLIKDSAKYQNCPVLPTYLIQQNYKS